MSNLAEVICLMGALDTLVINRNKILAKIKSQEPLTKDEHELLTIALDELDKEMDWLEGQLAEFSEKMPPEMGEKIQNIFNQKMYLNFFSNAKEESGEKFKKILGKIIELNKEERFPLISPFQSQFVNEVGEVVHKLTNQYKYPSLMSAEIDDWILEAKKLAELVNEKFDKKIATYKQKIFDLISV